MGLSNTILHSPISICMRIDKFLTETGTCSRSEAGKAVRKGEVLLNGRAVRSASEQIVQNVSFCIL